MATPVPARFLAVLLPAALVAGAVASLGRPVEREESPQAVQIEADLARTGADVVILGDSKVVTDLDTPALAAQLHDPALRIAPISIREVQAATWYAVLENRVYANGHRPRLVVFFAPMTSMLAVGIRGEYERTFLASQLGDDEPVIDEKAYGGQGSSAFRSRVKERRSALRDAILAGVRDVTVGALFASPGEGPLLARGDAVATPALAKLFGPEGATGEIERPNAIPIVEAREAVASTRAAALSPESSFVPDLVELARAHGSKVLFVRSTLSTKTIAKDPPDPETERAFVAWLAAHGAGWIDLTGEGYPDAYYGDGLHMNAMGRARVTAALAARMAEIGALSPGDFAPAKVAAARPRPTATRVGAPPALPPLVPVRGPHACGWEAPTPTLSGISDFAMMRDGLAAASPLRVLEDGRPLAPHAPKEQFDLSCAGAFSHQTRSVKFSPSGDDPAAVASRTYMLALAEEAPVRAVDGTEAWWVYPGTTLRLAFPEALSGSVAVRALPRGGGPGVATLRVGDTLAPMRGEGELAAVARAASDTLEIASPADGPWLLVRQVVVGTADDPRYVVGGPERAAGANLLTSATPAFAADPPALGAPGTPSPTAFGTVARFPVGALGVPPSDLVLRAAGTGGCSPLRLSEDGAPLPMPNQTYPDIEQAGKGRYAHRGAELYVSTVDGTSPVSNGRRYTVALDPDRRCRSRLWLYPGDAVTLAADASGLARELSGPATRLVLAATPFLDAAGDGDAHVRVRAGDAVLLDETFRVSALADAVLEWPLAQPVEGGALAVEIALPAGSPYVLLNEVGLARPPRPVFEAVATASSG